MAQFYIFIDIVAKCNASVGYSDRMGRRAASNIAATTAARGTVTTQATTILLSTFHCTLLGPLSIMPTATMDPIWQCVLLTGMPAGKRIAHLENCPLMQDTHTAYAA